MSTRARLTISFTALFGMIVVALAVAAYVVVRNDAYSKLDSALEVATGATAMSAEHEFNEHRAKAGGESDLQSVLDQTGSPDLADTQILVREHDRNVAYKQDTQAIDLRTIARKDLKNGATIAGLRIATRSLPAPKFHTAYEIYSAKPMGPSLAQLERIRVGLLVFVPIGLGLAGLGGYLLAKRSLRPLQDLAGTIDALTFSNLTARVQVPNNSDEIARLGSRFNSLLDRLQDAFKVQRRFMADASHQIRTPVTIALTASQVTARDPDATVSDCKESLQIISHQMLQLRRIIEDMFFLSQADTASLKVERKEVYLDDAIAEAVRAAKTLAVAKEQRLKLHSLAEARCLGDGDLLKQAILALLDNAVKFTPPGGNVDVALERRADRWVCSVTNTGNGISEAARSRVFERFFRERQPGNGTATGAGLGLAIARSIAESHGGTLSLVASHPGQTTFALAIPVFEREANPDEVQANSLAVRM